MSWAHEFKHALRNNVDLQMFFERSFPEVTYPIFIPRTFASKILLSGEGSPLWKQFLPDQQEGNFNVGMLDPIGDKVHAKGAQLIHRYQNRALFTPTTVCPISCRYCFRKNELSGSDDIFDPDFSTTIHYLNSHPEINEIILTGGDPFILSNEKLAFYIQEFSQIPHIKYLRFHTRTPIILPSRIDEGLIAILQSANALFVRSPVMIHCNHPSELDQEVLSAIDELIAGGIDVYSQSVLLKGINDNTECLYELFTLLSDHKIRPYALHHPDQALGAMHFYLPLEDGRKIFNPLREKLSGWSIPQYLIDIPGGEGKTNALNPESLQFSGELVNRFGQKIKIN